MSANPSVGIRFSKLDKAALVELASRLEMNQTQTVRTLVRETLAVLKEREAALITNQSSKNRTASNAKPPTS